LFYLRNFPQMDAVVARSRAVQTIGCAAGLAACAAGMPSSVERPQD
jgi:hypothetical protein